MSYTNIIVEKREGIAKITLNRPKALNALNTPLLLELKRALEDIREDKEVNVVILTGAGRAFCAGMDINALSEPRPTVEGEESVDPLFLILEVFEMIENLEQPVIAAVNGYSITGGLELTLSCDMVVASENAMFGDTHARISFIPGGGDSQRLPRVVGIMKAKEMLFTSEFIPAEEAKQIGMVNKVVAPEKLEEAAEELARKILANDQTFVRKIKSLVNRGMRLDFGGGMMMEKWEFMQFCQRRRPQDLEQRKQAVLGKGKTQPKS